MPSEYDELMYGSVEDFFAHVGVKGMKWGVRKDAGHEGEAAKTKTIAKLDKKFEKSFAGPNGYFKVHNEWAGEMNKRLDAFNDNFAKTKNPDGIDLRDSTHPVTKAYYKEYEKVVEAAALAAAKNLGSNASGTLRVKMGRSGEGENATWTAEFEEIKHADSGSTIFKITPKFNAKGYIISQKIELIDDSLEQSDTDEFLAHFGVKGMRWGHRRVDYPGASRKTNREAAKDANEFARAKLFYGEGAGTRRKLIKATVEAKAKKDAIYKAAFDHHFEQQNLGVHAEKARGERRRKDVKAKVGKTARGVNRSINGDFAVPIGAAAVAGAYTVAKAKGWDQDAIRYGSDFVSKFLR